MKVKKRKRLLWKVAAGVALAVVALAVWGFVVEPDRVVLREEALELGAGAEGLRGLRMVAVSDVHAGAPHVKGDKLGRLVEVINGARPDVVVFLGDFVIHEVRGGEFMEPEVIAAGLRGIEAPLGVYAVLGNHDWWFDGERVRRALEAEGVRVLENEVARIEKDGRAFWLAGLADLWTRRPDVEGTLRKVGDAAPVFLLTHNPDVFPKVPPRVALTLAGHTHGGQVNIPFWGRPVVPSNFGERYAQGHVVEDGRHLYVTSGVGTSIIPVRFRVPPELVLITLR